MNKKLTMKQQLFVDEYPKDWNATQAALRAGYSKRTAHVIGGQNLQKLAIQQALASKKELLAKKCGISTERLVKEWDCMAYQNPDDLIEIDGNGYATFRKWQDIPESVKRSMSEIQTITHTDGRVTFKVKFYNKQVALRNLGEMNGNYVERKEIGRPGEFEGLSDNELDDAIAEDQRTLRQIAEGKTAAGGKKVIPSIH